jgi:teichuronic acid biosynthesis glycosyltransferase TuaC
MKVLFVCSGNSRKFDIPPFIKEQGISLIEQNVEVAYFPIRGKGITGYFKSIKELKKFLKSNPVDLIHAHYTLSGLTSVLAKPKVPIVLSLMGSDAYGEYSGPKKVVLSSRFLTLFTLIIQPFVNAIISKSFHISSFVYRKKYRMLFLTGLG